MEWDDSKRITHLNEVEDEIWGANKRPSPQVAGPHGVTVRLHGVVVVGGAVDTVGFWNCSKWCELQEREKRDDVHYDSSLSTLLG